MGNLKKKVVHDAGITNPSKLSPEIDDGGSFVSAPRSNYHIDSTINLVFTENTKVLESNHKHLRIADGDRRPGWAE